jgi:myosin heavy subunit
LNCSLQKCVNYCVAQLHHSSGRSHAVDTAEFEELVKARFGVLSTQLHRLQGLLREALLKDGKSTMEGVKKLDNAKKARIKRKTDVSFNTRAEMHGARGDTMWRQRIAHFDSLRCLMHRMNDCYQMSKKRQAATSQRGQHSKSPRSPATVSYLFDLAKQIDLQSSDTDVSQQKKRRRRLDVEYRHDDVKKDLHRADEWHEASRNQKTKKALPRDLHTATRTYGSQGTAVPQAPPRMLDQDRGDALVTFAAKYPSRNILIPGAVEKAVQLNPKWSGYSSTVRPTVKEESTPNPPAPQVSGSPRHDCIAMIPPRLVAWRVLDER